MVDRGVEPILVEVAILGDKDHIVNSVLAHEIKDHMATPMSLLLLVVLVRDNLVDYAGAQAGRSNRGAGAEHKSTE